VSKASALKWQKENPEMVREKMQRWRENNPEKVIQINAEQYKKHQVKILGHKRKVYNNNPEKQRIRARQWQLNNPEKHKASKLKSLYGLSVEEHQQLLDDTNGKCPICGKDFSEARACVDHDHETGIVRGMICSNCNSAIGLLNENIDVLLNAINYLEGGMRNDR